MSAAGTIDSLCSGHGGFPSRKTAEAEPFMTINGKPTLVDGNLFPDHSDGNSTHSGVAVSTRPWFTIQGKAIACVDDPVSCGSVVATGDAFFQVR